MMIEGIQGMFPIPVSAYETNGTQEGLIVNFLGYPFYLKIYYSSSNSDYVVQGYHDGDSNPHFTDNIPTRDFRRYAAKYTVPGVYCAMNRNG